MRHTHILTTLVIFAVTGIVSHSSSPAHAWQGNDIMHLNEIMANAASVSDEMRQDRKSLAQVDWFERKSLIHKVGTDVYSGMSTPSGTPQGAVPGNQPNSTGDYKFSSPSNDSRYGSTSSNPSDNYLKKESSGPSTGPYGGPYGGSVYGGLPSTPSADPMIKDLSR
ncbi:MAG: hypothetical protein JNN16_18520 [Nitrospira sp.]|nr:hypothetical protein [Nitrospira sp.]